jgi:uroporphyrinogen-III synthase
LAGPARLSADEAQPAQPSGLLPLAVAEVPRKALQVIVTRPLAQALPWVDALRASGFAAHALPLIAIEPVADPQPIRQVWRSLGSYSLVMFVSANAVAHFFAQQPDDVDWPLSALAASTGPGTTAALQQAGLRGAMIVEPLPGKGFDSEALWSRLSSRNWSGSRVLVVRGEEGREWLADQFRTAGAHVDSLAAYRRLAPSHGPAIQALLADAVADPGSYCWFFSSSEAIGHLVELVPMADWAAARALVTHLRIAQTARAAGFGDVQLVDPQPNSVVAAIRQIEHLPPMT